MVHLLHRKEYVQNIMFNRALINICEWMHDDFPVTKAYTYRIKYNQSISLQPDVLYIPNPITI